MRLDRLATLYFAKPLRKLAPLPEEGCVSILMYHRISDAREAGLAPYFRLNTSPARFQEQMKFLEQGRYKVVELSHALKFLSTNSYSRKHVVITFDDAYADFAEHASPVLQEYGFPATVFVPTDYIADHRKIFKGAPCLTWSEIKEFRKSGIHFGSHTVTHPTLRELTWSEVGDELIRSKRILEDHLQEPITTFAYPYAYPEGDSGFTGRFSALAKDAGYQCCVTTRIGIAQAGDDLFSLKRLPVNDCDDLSLFQAKLEGAYDWLSLPQRLRKKTRKSPGTMNVLPSHKAGLSF